MPPGKCPLISRAFAKYATIYTYRKAERDISGQLPLLASIKLVDPATLFFHGRPSSWTTGEAIDGRGFIVPGWN